MASLFDLDGLVGEHRVHASESPVQHRPSAYGILSVIAIFRQMTLDEAATAQPKRRRSIYRPDNFL
jgi:hypothetical protein